MTEEQLQNLTYNPEHRDKELNYWTQFKALFQNATMRKRLLVMYIQWVTIVLVYNGLTLNNVNLVNHPFYIKHYWKPVLPKMTKAKSRHLF